MGFMKKSVELNRDGLIFNQFLTRSYVKWGEISEIYAEKISKITYDEIFITIVTDKEYLSIGEMDIGFRAAEIGLNENLYNFPREWQSIVENSELGVSLRIWSRVA